MSSPSAIAANLSCLLHLVQRHPDREKELGEVTRLLRESLGEAVTIEATPTSLIVGGELLELMGPGIPGLHERMLAHRVHRITLPTRPEVAVLDSLAAHLAGVPDAVALASLIPALETASVSVELTTPEDDHSDFQTGDMSAFTGTRMLDLGELSVSPAPSEPIPPLPHPAAEEAGPQVEDPRTLERLRHGARAARDAGDNTALLEVVHDFLEAEAGATSRGTAAMYRIELKRVVSRRDVAEFARMAAGRDRRELALEVLHRLGPDAAEILMDELVKADSRTARRIFFSTLMRIGTGADVIIQHLSHPTWFVVRNAADLCGEMRLGGAVPLLARHAGHPDERVRKSVAGALARIGTPEAAEALGRMIRDPAPAIRAQALASLEGPRARQFVMPLAALLSTEQDSDVLRQVLRALGRVATPEALQLLQRASGGEFRGLRRLRGEAADVLSAARAARGAAR